MSIQVFHLYLDSPLLNQHDLLIFTLVHINTDLAESMAVAPGRQSK